MANATLGDVVVNLRSHDVNMTSGLNKINHTLESSMGKLRSFRAITELAFGFHVGRFFLEKVHEGIVHIAEGMREAIHNGESFGDVLGDGLKKAIGLKTVAEEIAEAKKHEYELEKQIADERERSTKAAREYRDFSQHVRQQLGEQRTIKLPHGEAITPNDKDQGILRGYDTKIQGLDDQIKDTGLNSRQYHDIQNQYLRGEITHEKFNDELAALNRKNLELRRQRNKLDDDRFKAELIILQHTTDEALATERTADWKRREEAEQSEFEQANRALEAAEKRDVEFAKKRAETEQRLADRLEQALQRRQERLEDRQLEKRHRDQEHALSESRPESRLIGLEEYARQLLSGGGNEKQIDVLKDQLEAEKDQIEFQREMRDILRDRLKNLVPFDPFGVFS